MSLTNEKLLIVLVLVVVSLFGIRGCMNQKEEKEDVQELTIKKDDTLKRYKDAKGREHGQKVLAEASKAIITSVYRKQIDSLTAALDIKEKQLQAFTAVGTVATGTVNLKVDTVMVDSSSKYLFSYRDQWLDLVGNISDRSSLTYKIYDSVILSTYWRRKWLLGSKTTYVDGYSLNPSVRLSGLTGVRISTKYPGRLGIGPALGFGFTGTGWYPFVGVSLQYAVIRL